MAMANTTEMIFKYILPIILFLAGQTIFIIIAWINFRTETLTRLKVIEREVELEIKALKQNEREMFDKLDELLRAIHRVEIDLSNKKNRSE